MAEDWSRYAVSSDNSDNAPKTDWSQYAAKEEPGLLDRISEGVSKLTEEHPQVASKIREIFTGTSPELEQKRKEAGIIDVKGPGLMEVPGARKLSDAVREAGRTSGSYWKGFGASLLGDVIDLAGSGFDPRAVSPEKIPFKTGEVVPEEAAPITDESRLLPPAKTYVSPKGTAYAGELPIRRSVETPYRMEETTPPSTDIIGPIRRPPEALIPPTDVAREFAPVGEEGDLLKPSGFVSDKNADELSYELAKKKFGMGLEPSEEPAFARTKPTIEDLKLYENKLIDELQNRIKLEPDNEALKKELDVRLKFKNYQDNLENESAEKPKITGEQPQIEQPQIEQPQIEQPKSFVNPFDVKTNNPDLQQALGLVKSDKPIPNMTQLQNHGDGVLTMRFDYSHPLLPMDLKEMFPNEDIKITDLTPGMRGYQEFRVDTTPENADKIESDLGGSFDKERQDITSEAGFARIKSTKQPPNKGPNGAVLDKLFRGLQDAQENMTSQEVINRAERAKRFAAFEGVKETGAAGAAKSLGKLKGEYEKADLVGDRLKLNQGETDQLFNAIKTARITTGEKARAYTSMFKLLNGGEPLQRNELRLLNDVFGNGFADRIIQLHGGLGATGIKLAKAANTMKSAMTLVHFSAPLRQGLGLIHTPEWRDAFVQMFKYFGNKTYYDAAMQAIEQRPNYLLGRQAGLFMSKPSSFLEGEEEFMNNYIPGLPSGIKSLFIKDTYEASQRAYIGFLNKLRADAFDDLISDAKKIGHEAFTVSEDAEGNKSIVPSKTTENIAKFINNATGRGSLGALEKIAPELNTVIWSPRLIASRLNYLNPKYYAEFDPFTRKQAIKSLFAIAASSSAILGLAKLAGAKVSNDPTSADFHKARFPKGAVLDPNGGYQQPVVAAARIINEANRMRKGAKARFGEPTIPDIAGNFVVSKLSPMAGLAYDIATAKQFTGGGGYVNRFGSKTSVQSETMNRFLPIFAQDTYKLIQTDPGMAELLGAGTANLFGAGLQDYPEKRPFSSRGVRVPNPVAR